MIVPILQMCGQVSGGKSMLNMWLFLDIKYVKPGKCVEKVF